METDLTGRLPLREHIKNMKKIFGVIHGMDRSYFWFTGIVHMINVTVPYLGLLLSAYVLDALPKGDYREIIRAAVVTTAAVFFLNCIASTIWNRMEVRRERMFFLYSSGIGSKMLTMDFAKIDSEEVRELRRRIQRDLNWGNGNTVFYNINGIFYGILNIFGAVVFGAQVMAEIAVSCGAAAAFALVVFLAAAGAGFRNSSMKKVHRYMFWTLGEDEKEEALSGAWDLAMENEGFHSIGKQIRLYDGYSLMKRWTVDPLFSGLSRKKLKDGAAGQFGEGFFGAFAETIMRNGAYLPVVLAALGGGVSIGNVVRFAGCIGSLMAAVSGLVMGIQEFALTARKNVSTLEFLELENEMYAGKLPVEKRSDNEYQIEFRDVSFCYPGTETYALRHVSMKLQIGEKLAIVGMNGSGKTTLIKLLCRLYDPTEGEILLNGVDIRKFRKEEYSRLFSVVFQDYVLFPFQLGENVAVSVDYDAGKAAECLTDAGFGERLEELDHGLKTYLYKGFDEDGLEISGGEAQKIAIARSVYKEAPFVLLDEPTAALDPLAEYGIYTKFDSIVKDKTAIYISHRLSSCRFCKKIAVFHEGRLVQMGSHDELVKDRQGKYYEMWLAQAQYYDRT